MARRRPTHRVTSPARTQLARPSGRQDSNLRPLVPQTSTYFPMSGEFELEWFCGELVGMTTSAGVMESGGVAEKYRALFDGEHRLLLEAPDLPREITT
jgi:hypothetical protein